MECDVANYALKGVTVPRDLASSGTNEERASAAKAAFEALAGSIAQELSNLSEVRNRFFESFTKSVKVELSPTTPLELNEESLAQLSEAECRRALLIAARTIEYSRRITDVGLNQAVMYFRLSGHRQDEIDEWDPKASELAREVDRLHAEAEAQEQQVKKMTDSLKNCSKRLNALVSASRRAAKGQMHATRADELEGKLQCSICMDRPKNVAFACGHTCCDGCASKWKRCPNKCEGPKSHKPVRHTFPLYL